MKSLNQYIAETQNVTEALKPMQYELQRNIGKAKYVVNYCDGEKKHNDGSDFADIRTFNNKKDANKFVKELISKGYTSKHVSNLFEDVKEVSPDDIYNVAQKLVDLINQDIDFLETTNDKYAMQEITQLKKLVASAKHIANYYKIN